MSHFGSGVEHGLHCLVTLCSGAEGELKSVRELAVFLGIPQPYTAKLFNRFRKAGIVTAVEGIQGGFRLARSPDRITVMEVIDAVEGRKPLYQCRNIRDNCILNDTADTQPDNRQACAIHMVMIRAEISLRKHLHRVTLADIAEEMDQQVPASFDDRAREWFSEQRRERNEIRTRRLD